MDSELSLSILSQLPFEKIMKKLINNYQFLLVSIFACANLFSAPKLKLEKEPTSQLKSDLQKLQGNNLRTALSTLDLLGNQTVTNDIASLNVDKSGRIFYACKFNHKESKKEFIASKRSKGTSVPITSPPIRHSKPGSANILYLDFNGGLVSNTWWERDGVDWWDCKPFDIDNDETTFSPEEQDKIILFWEFVAEDFAPFDVDVTTEAPAVYPARNTGWAMITKTVDKNGNNCPHHNYGGIAYVNVFGRLNYPSASPAWVKEYSNTYTAEAASHELGHNMGLSHDGTSKKEYYGGHDGGVIYWNAIMGGGSTPDISQWSQGEYYDANQTQDDLAIISGKLGYRPDDHGNANASSSILNLSGANIDDSGYIETTGDSDVFEFETDTGSITLTATPYKHTIPSWEDWGSNLDILLELHHSSGLVLVSNNPPNDVTASITATVPDGTYYLHIKSTGTGTPMNSTPTGFTVYGSLGSYELSGTINPIPEPALIINYCLLFLLYYQKRKLFLPTKTRIKEN